MRPLRVLLVEQSAAVREALAARLRHEEEIAEVEACASAECLAGAGPADVVIVHYRFYEVVVAQRPGVPVVVISGGPPPPDFRGIWVMKPAPMADLLPAVKAAVAAKEG